MNRSIAIIVSLAFTSSFAQSPSAIVDKYYRAVGGIENWESLRTAYVESRAMFLGSNLNAISGMHDPDTSFNKTYRVWPDKGMSQTYQDSVITITTYSVKKKHFFIFMGMPPVERSPGPYEPYFEFEPVMVKNTIKKSKSLELVGRTNIFSSECFDIKVYGRELTWHLYFNVSDSLLVAWSNSPYDTHTTITRVFDYRRLDNLLMAFGEEKYNNGHVFFWGERSKVDLNIPIDDKIFEYQK
jgi:hypothetical protein